MNAAVIAHSHAVLAAKARSFHLASRLLPRAVRDDAALVYAFCRTVDDAVDEAPDRASAALALDSLEAEVAGQAAARPLVAAFRAAAERLDLPPKAATELIRGVRADLGRVRVADDVELLRYCYRVGSTVGLMMCAVLGVRRASARPHAVDLGVAMQLTNICRDVAEDAARDRVYLPATRLAAAGVDPEALIDGRADGGAVAGVILDLLVLADRYYESADHGMRDIPWRARQSILVASRVYRGIGVRLKRNGGGALAGRTVVSLPRKLARGTAALARGCAPPMLNFGPRTPHNGMLHRALRGLPQVNHQDSAPP